VPDVVRTIQLLNEMDATLVAVGHGRDPRCVAAARAFVATWPREIAIVVDWPPAAASWLRHAQRLTATEVDAWVIADTPAGWEPVARRLRETGRWDPMRTVMVR
jgi:hypothetical protein